jgi:tetratricopeptide (TPR) repeat protein
VAAAHVRIADVLVEEGKLDDALEAYELAAAIHRATLGERHTARGDDEYNVARVKNMLGDAEGACEHAERARSLHTESKGAESQAVARDLVEVSICELAQHRRRKGIEALEQAYRNFVKAENAEAIRSVGERLKKLGAPPSK